MLTVVLKSKFLICNLLCSYFPPLKTIFFSFLLFIFYFFLSKIYTSNTIFFILQYHILIHIHILQYHILYFECYKSHYMGVVVCFMQTSIVIFSPMKHLTSVFVSSWSFSKYEHCLNYITWEIIFMLVKSSITICYWLYIPYINKMLFLYTQKFCFLLLVQFYVCSNV